MSNFKEQFKQDKEENAKAKSEWYKFQDGDNRVRILETPVKFAESYDPKLGYLQLWHECGIKGSIKYLTRAWLYKKDKDGNEVGELVLTKLSFKLMDAIVGLMEDQDYAFESFPMPYNINVKTTGAGTTDVNYNIVPSPKLTDVPAEALEALKDQTPLADIIEKMKEKSKKKYEANGQMEKLTGKDLPTIEYPEDDLGGATPF
jgi:hypothetical protein